VAVRAAGATAAPAPPFPARKSAASCYDEACIAQVRGVPGGIGRDSVGGEIMNRIMMMRALACATLVSSSIVCAQQQVPAAAGDSVQVKISKNYAATEPYKLAPQEFGAYAQPYLLETGLVLTFEQQRQRYFTQVRNEARVEIFPLAAGVFSSADGTLFVFRDGGDSIAVSHLERLPFAGHARIDPQRVYLAGR
jgi:hypothetical protein